MRRLDWILASAVFILLAVGLVSLASISSNFSFPFFGRQLIWAALGIVVFFTFSFFDYRILRNYSGLLLILYGTLLASLVTLFIAATRVRGVLSWFHIGSFAIEPGEFMKIVLILILAKYFSVRHIEIANVRHILVSGFYALVPALLVFLQPDFGSAIIIFSVWFGGILHFARG